MKSALYTFEALSCKILANNKNTVGYPNQNWLWAKSMAISVSIYQLIQSNTLWWPLCNWLETNSFSLIWQKEREGALHKQSSRGLRRRERLRRVRAQMAWEHKRPHRNGPMPTPTPWPSSMAQAVNCWPSLPAPESYDWKSKLALAGVAQWIECQPVN